MGNTRYIWFLLLAFAMLAIPPASSAQIAVGISVRVGPPVLPVYAQPICPGEGFIWTPGYWAYGDDGYYWVPGTWVRPPRIGVLWTPGYWGWGEGVYLWHGGYWGPHIGFYSGINYGFGYVGTGYWGGEWRGGVFAYNRAVNNVNVTVIHNTYNKTVINNNTTVNRTSFNGGTGGTNAQPTSQERNAEHENHVAPTNEQTQHEHLASTTKSQYASVNHGQPTVAASSKPGVLSGKGVVGARNASATNNTGGNKGGANGAGGNKGGSTNGAANANKGGTGGTGGNRPPNARNSNSPGNGNGKGGGGNAHTNTTPPSGHGTGNGAPPPRGGNQGAGQHKNPPPPPNKGRSNPPPPPKGPGKGDGRGGGRG